jgi:hypothetical protein
MIARVTKQRPLLLAHAIQKCIIDGVKSLETAKIRPR